ncbi:MAG: hypothetical protein ABW252_16215 [Polyangiales bacterium]
MSPEGPTITHVRGIMMVNSVDNLRSVGLYDEYERLMPKAHLEVVQQSVAMAWIPVATTVAHYLVSDRLPLMPEHLAAFGERQARRVTETFLGITLRRARSLGVDAVKQTIREIGRLHERLYRGGGCSVIDVGPKDIVLELHGFPFAQARTFKAAWTVYVQAIAESFSKVAYVKLTRPREPHPHRVAIMASWV